MVELRNPTHVVVGTSDLDSMARFFAVFGFAESSRSTLPAEVAAALYGVGAPLDQRELRAAGAQSGHLLLVGCSQAAREYLPFERGPIALDLYTIDLDRSLDVVREARLERGPVGRVELGPLALRQCRVLGPDRVPLVLVEASRRRPSLLDATPDSLHSEVSSVVWSVDNAAASGAFWSAHAGLTFTGPYPVTHPEVSAFMGLPRPDVPIQMGLISDAAGAPLRLEPLTFTSDPGPATAPPRGLVPGLHAVVFEVADLDAAVKALQGARMSARVETAEGRRISGMAPDGVRFELWQRG